MALPQGEWIPLAGQDSLATQLISGDIRPQLIPSVAMPISIGSANGSLSIIPCFYDLAQADNRLMVEWLLSSRPRWSRGLGGLLRDLFGFTRIKLQDISYALAEGLQAEVVAKAFDVVIIDCPPRLTTSAIQAFCASSHLLVPTIFDRASSEAVLSFHQQIETLKSNNICPNLRYLGVVGTKWRDDQKAPQQARKDTEFHLKDSELAVLPTTMFFRHATAIVNDADEGIAYLRLLSNQAHAPIINPIRTLAGHVVAQMGLVNRRTNFAAAAE